MFERSSECAQRVLGRVPHHHSSPHQPSPSRARLISRARVKALSSGINATIRLPLGFVGGYACLLGLYNTWAALSYWARFVFIFMGVHACWNATFFGTRAIQAEVVDSCKRVLDAEGIEHSKEGEERLMRLLAVYVVYSRLLLPRSKTLSPHKARASSTSPRSGQSRARP